MSLQSENSEPTGLSRLWLLDQLRVRWCRPSRFSSNDASLLPIAVWELLAREEEEMECKGILAGLRVFDEGILPVSRAD